METEFYFINTRSDSGVMNFKDEANWDKVIRRFGVCVPEPWVPLDVEILNGKTADFVYFGRHLVCSQKYWDEIFSKLVPEVEGLELLCGNKKYYLINAFFKDTLVDFENSKLLKDSFSGKILNAFWIRLKKEAVSIRAFRISFYSEFFIISRSLRDEILAYGPVGLNSGPLPELDIVNDNLVRKI